MGALVALLLLPLSSLADEFAALPGLWKTTTRSAGQAPQVRWHCVHEDSDPWVDFAELDGPPDESCKRNELERSATSLKWKLDCKGSASEGTVVFDSASHYRGIMQLAHAGEKPRGIQVEGQRYAACTDPSD